MADSEISVKIVADIEEVKRSLAEMTARIGNVEKVGGVSLDNVFGKASVLAIGFNSVTQAVGFLAEKLRSVTVDLAMVGERASQVESGFIRLADNAGLAGESLKQSIIDAAQGTIETTDLLRRSSELVVAFGEDARRIPELIEISRKAARSFGLDTSEAFDRLSEAVRNGSDRALKQLGIIIDLDKAKRDYAASIGVAVNELSREGEATARLNALLDAADKKFGKVDLQNKTLSESFASFNNSIGNFIETVGSAITRTGVLQSVFSGLGSVVDTLTQGFNSLFGTEAQKAAAQIPSLTNALRFLNEELSRIESGKQPLMSRLFGRTKEDVLKEIDDVSQRLELMKAKASASQETFGPPAPPVDSGEGKLNLEKRLENQRKFHEEINKLRLQEAQNSIKLAQDQESLEIAQNSRRLAMEQELELRKQEIKNNEILTKSQQDALILEQETLHKQNLLLLQEQEEAEYMAMLERKLQASQAVNDQIAASAEIQARRTQQSWQKAGGLGGAAMQAFSNRTVAAFAAVGAGTMTVAEAMKSAFFGMLGDVAMAQGKTMFLTNLAPPLGPNPAGIAAGLGLIALGGLLSSLGGGKQSIGGGAGVGGGVGGDFGSPFGGPTIADATERRREVVINIEGNYFDNEQTRLAIVEAVRSAGDAADFTIQRGNRR